METVTIFRNPEQVSTQEVLKIFNRHLKESRIFQETEIEMLAEAYAKNLVDKFIITNTPDVEVAQGDILIWAEGTTMYDKEYDGLINLSTVERLVLQEGDSMTGDHRIIPLKGSDLTVKEGTFKPTFLRGKSTWSDPSYSALVVESDKPFLVIHREHGNIALPSGKYMVCSQLDAKTLEKMMD